MDLEGLSRDDFKMLYDKLGEKDDFLQTIYDTAFGFNLRQDQFSEKTNKCAWLKIGKHGFCGKPCKDAFCHNHMLKRATGSRTPLPCLVCGVGVINSKVICKPCRLEEKTRQRGLLLAKEFEDAWEAEPPIGSYAWHVKKSGENASEN